VEAVVSTILIFSVDALSATLHLMAELAAFGGVCTSAVFICGSCRCRWNLYGSACTDIPEELLSTVCISVSTDTEILSAFLLPETSAFALSIDMVAARRLLAITVVINRASADEVCARRRAAGGTLMTVSAASLPLDAADR